MGGETSEYAKRIRKGVEDKEVQGRDVEVDYTFTRHGIPFTDPATKMSMDKITEQGLRDIEEKGRMETQERYLMVKGSAPLKRARETGQKWLKGVEKTGKAILINRENKEGKPIKPGTLAEFGIYPIPDLNIVKDSGKMVKPINANADRLINEGMMSPENRGGYNMSKLVDIPEEEWIKQGVQTPRDVARMFANQLMHGIRESGNLFAGMKKKVNNFTHATMAESLLKYVIILEDKNGKKKTGFDTVDELSPVYKLSPEERAKRLKRPNYEFGTLKPGESVDFKIKRDAAGEVSVKVLFRGDEYPIDMVALQKLADEYKEMKRAKRAAKTAPKTEEKKAA